MELKQYEETFKRVSEQFAFEDAHLELASARHTDDIVRFMKTVFMPDVPVCVAVGLRYDDHMIERLRQRLSHSLTFVLAHNKTGEIVGLLIGHFIEKQKHGTATNEAFRILIDFFGQKDGEMTVFDKYDVTKVIRIAVLGVDRGYRKKGIGRMLLQVALAYYRDRETGPVAMKAECLNRTSDAIFEKCGFELMHDLPYVDYKVGDEFIFKHISDSARIRVKLM